MCINLMQRLGSLRRDFGVKVRNQLLPRLGLISLRRIIDLLQFHDITPNSPNPPKAPGELGDMNCRPPYGEPIIQTNAIGGWGSH